MKASRSVRRLHPCAAEERERPNSEDLEAAICGQSRAGMETGGKFNHPSPLPRLSQVS
jgi:hypothetical protein